MLHPLFSTLISRPDLLLDHVSAYAALIHEEVSVTGEELLQRSLAWLAAALCAAVFLGLAGTALMLGILLDRFHWILLATPAVMLVLLGVALLKTRGPRHSDRFSAVKEQVTRDTQALRAAA
jgi:uncharacterized membrane protein YqjE